MWLRSHLDQTWWRGKGIYLTSSWLWYFGYWKQNWDHLNWVQLAKSKYKSFHYWNKKRRMWTSKRNSLLCHGHTGKLNLFQQNCRGTWQFGDFSLGHAATRAWGTHCSINSPTENIFPLMVNWILGNNPKSFGTKFEGLSDWNTLFSHWFFLGGQK